MRLFSPKARRLIEAAVAQLPDPDQRKSWSTWAGENPDAKLWTDQPDARGHLPRGVAAVALAALERMSSELKGRLHGGGLDEEDVLDVEGDLTFIQSVEALLIEELHASRQTA